MRELMTIRIEEGFPGPTEERSRVPVALGSRGYLKEPSLWNPEVAQLLATKEGIGQLREEHWKALEYVRDYACEHSTRPLFQEINKWLYYSLFTGYPRDAGVDVRRLFPGSADLVFKVAGL